MFSFKVALFIVGVSVASAVSSDLSHLCDHLLEIDCRSQYVKGEQDEQVCGSDGVTYDNFCYYSQARCTNRNMAMLYTGACSAPTTGAPTVTAASGSTTMMTQTMTTTIAASTSAGPTTQDPLLSVFCQSKNSITCGQDLDPICGSDKKFYLNQCEFSKAFCDNPTLLSKDISFCTGK